MNTYGKLISANAYLGADAILPALETDAQIILTGRVADPSLFLAPMIHELAWEVDNYALLGQGTMIGHLMECAGQLTGGYFADPVTKPVPDMHILGHPLADIRRDGTAVFSKIAETGGLISLQTAKEQLLYEVLDPKNYFTPDVVADFSNAQLQELGVNLLQATGGCGKSKPDTLKVTVGYQAGWIGEGEISYAGSHALERARLAGDIIQKRIGDQFRELRVDLIGQNSLHGEPLSQSLTPYEVRLRIGGKSDEKELAQRVGEEVEALYTNGPAGGGGARKFVQEVIGVVSILMDRKMAPSQVQIFES